MNRHLQLKGDNMSVNKRSEKRKLVDRQIYDRFEQLDNTIADPEADAKEIENIKDLIECKEKLEKPKFDMNWSTVISSGLGFLGILALIAHERDGVVASKISQIIPVSKFLK